MDADRIAWELQHHHNITAINSLGLRILGMLVSNVAPRTIRSLANELGVHHGRVAYQVSRLVRFGLAAYVAPLTVEAKVIAIPARIG